MNNNLVNERIGTIKKNNYGSNMKIVEYKNTSDILVQFNQGNLVHTSWSAFCKGNVRNVYDKSVYAVGFLGEGDYRSKINGKITHHHLVWREMLRRCYDAKSRRKHPTYVDCIVCDEWHNFQVFAKWYDDNYYQIEGEIMELDKDILVKGNKVYSPETCVFVPKNINSLFVKKDLNRGILPIGVSFNNQSKKYQVVCRNRGELKTVGHYKTIEEAFQSYKKYKENLIKQIANEYKNKIPNKLYNALMNYNVEITD